MPENPASGDRKSPDGLTSSSDITTSNQSHDQPNTLPPAYSGPLTSTGGLSGSQPSPVTSIPGVPALPFSAYTPPSATFSKDRCTTTVNDSLLSSSSHALTKFLYEQIAVPPWPEIRITGTHTGWNGKETDFDVRLNLVRYILPEAAAKRLSYVNVINGRAAGFARNVEPASETTIQGCAAAYCAESYEPKSQVPIYTLLAALNYKGKAEVTFVTRCATVDIQPRRGIALFSTIHSAFSETKKYGLEVVWPYASMASQEGGDGGKGIEREFAVQSEAGWWNDWKAALTDAIVGKRQGWVGLEHWMELAMQAPKTVPKLGNWGVDAY